MKSEKIRDCIRNTRQGSIIDAPFRDEMATEAEAELATLIDRCAWEDAAKEKIAALEAANAGLRAALEFCSAHLTNDPLAAHERIRAALSATPDSGKMLVDEDAAMKQQIAEANAVLSAKPIDEIAALKHGPDLLEKLREIEWAASSQKRGGGFACTCPACGGWLEDEHSQDCWLDNILKTAREGGENA